MLYLPQSRSGPLPRLDRFPVRYSNDDGGTNSVAREQVWALTTLQQTADGNSEYITG